jgi:hypothetical protein
MRELGVGKITSWTFSKCGRYLYGMSIQSPSQVVQFDTQIRKIVRTIYDPLHVGAIYSMSLTIHESEIYCLGSINGSIMLAKLPFGPEAKYEVRIIAVAPLGILNCEKIRLCFPTSEDEAFVIVGQGTNFLRKDGRMGGNPQWPIVLTVKEKDMSPWREFEEREDPHLKNGISPPLTPKREVDNEDMEGEAKEDNPELPMIEESKVDAIQEKEAGQEETLRTDAHTKEDLNEAGAVHTHTDSNTLLTNKGEWQEDTVNTNSSLEGIPREASELQGGGVLPPHPQSDANQGRQVINTGLQSTKTGVGDSGFDKEKTGDIQTPEIAGTKNDTSIEPINSSLPDDPPKTGRRDSEGGYHAVNKILNTEEMASDMGEQATTVSGESIDTSRSGISFDEQNKSADSLDSELKNTQMSLDSRSEMNLIPRPGTHRSYDVSIGVLGVLVLSYLMHKYL